MHFPKSCIQCVPFLIITTMVICSYNKNKLFPIGKNPKLEKIYIGTQIEKMRQFLVTDSGIQHKIAYMLPIFSVRRKNRVFFKIRLVLLKYNLNRRPLEHQTKKKQFLTFQQTSNVFETDSCFT